MHFKKSKNSRIVAFFAALTKKAAKLLSNFKKPLAWYQQPEFRGKVDSALTKIIRETLGREPKNYPWEISEAKELLEEDFCGELSEILKNEPPFQSDHSLWPVNLPPNTKFCLLPPLGYRGGNNFKVVVVQEEPQVRTLWFSPNFLINTTPVDEQHKIDRAKGNLITISLPYVIFIITFLDNNFYQLNVFYSTTGIQSINDNLLNTNFPNCGDDSGAVCTGDFRRTRTHLSGQVKEIIDFFWQSMFTSAGSNYYLIKKQDARLDIWKWAKLTKTNPKFVLKVPWLKNKYTISQLVADQFSISVEDTLPYRLAHKAFLKTLEKIDYTTTVPLKQKIEGINRLFYSCLEQLADKKEER